jgi:serine/threonine-protein kinase
MLTGKKPFVEDADRSVLQKIRLDRYTPARRRNPRVPRMLERILGRCMEKLPADRYPSMQALIHDLEDLLASRVVINYNAFMVQYLKDQGVLTDDEASGILATGAVRAGQRIVREDRRTLRSVGLLNAIVLAVMLFGGLVVQLVTSDAGAGPPRPQAGIAVDPGEAGYVRVLADPWAEVYVDGVHMETTPFANPIPLTPGVHYIKLTNPYFKPLTREIQVETGRTVEVVEKLALEPASAAAELGAKR